MANTISPPPYETISYNNHIYRALDIVVLLLLTSLLVYRLLTLNENGFAWLLALLCESWFTFIWFLTVNGKWNPVEHKTYPERLPQKTEEFLPPLDMFVTTADPVLEPPIITMNTVISLLAVDYPAQFQQEWKDMKDKYERLSRKIQDAVKKGIPPYNLTGDLAVFSNIERRNHPSIIKYFGRGMNGIQGPCYGGTGCFHRRKVIYGLCPDEVESKASNLTSVTGNLAYEELQKIFGNSTEFIKSAAQALQGKTNIPNAPSNLVEAAAYQVAGCGYEYGTGWGTEVGWQYGSNTEDVLTGMKIHSRGWKSKYCNPDPPAFLGCAPSGGPSTLTQQKRWAIGLLEILICKNNPIFHTITAKLKFGQCLAYMWILVWALRCIPELCYVMLPAYCLITNSNFLPKVHEPAFYGYVALFLIYILYTISEYLETGLSIRAWWNRQRMTIITSTSAWLFAILSVILKILGISETVFEITRKEESTFTDDGDAGRFTFDGSPIFLPGTTILMVQFLALVMGLLSVRDGHYGSRFGEVFCSFLVMICFLPFLKGLFGKGKYGIPLSTICKSVVLSLSFVQLCKRAH
ncbi:hypothetical protein GH714_017879 [Hevea brasiliensis]|uniref:Cellulose synthase-like protein H1 n=1 Tax=Hevea brasiliensis TaxID=3981 RepID=A0A6A6KVM8_HEVBR|nr:hypothetical protein GH714_017879 [Hevea brasiliensis]